MKFCGFPSGSALVLMGLAVVTGHVLAQTDSTVQVGPSMHCGSSFQAGYSNCVSPKSTAAVVDPKKVAASTEQVQIGSPSHPTTPTPVKRGTEEEIDSWLANHGKPSREAARAILDPTDENIAAMARRIRQDSAVAAYVAQRMTTLQEVDSGLIALNPQFNSEDLPMLAGMRVVLHVATGCRTCETAAIMMQRLVAESPVLDVRVVMHGIKSGNELMLEMARLGITLPTTIAGPESAKFSKAVPIAVVADTRQGKEALIRTFRDTQTARTAIAALRKQANLKGEPQ